MKKSSKPVTGGILTLLSGALAIFGAMNYAVGYINARSFGKGDIPPFVPSIIFGVPLMSIVVGVVALVGGNPCRVQEEVEMGACRGNRRGAVAAATGHSG